MEGNGRRGRGFAAYFRTVWFDYLCLIAVAAFTLRLYVTPTSFDQHVVPMSPPRAVFNMEYTFNEMQFPREISYPQFKEPLSTVSCALAVVCLPLIIVGTHQVFLAKSWNIWDFHAGVVGVLKAAVSTSFITTVLKHHIGGFRPYFLDACKPDWDLLSARFAQGHNFDANVCTGDMVHVNRALQTFPSGHAASSFAAAVFVTLYLNARLKVLSDQARDVWAFMVVLAPLTLASLVSASMYTSHQHHAHDMIFGMIIGLVLGVLAYRSTYSAILDFRYNHIPLLPAALKIQHFSAHGPPKVNNEDLETPIERSANDEVPNENAKGRGRTNENAEDVQAPSTLASLFSVFREPKKTQDPKCSRGFEHFRSRRLHAAGFGMFAATEYRFLSGPNQGRDAQHAMMRNTGDCGTVVAWSKSLEGVQVTGRVQESIAKLNKPILRPNIWGTQTLVEIARARTRGEIP